MNTSILRKCIEEINKDKPNLDYIRGILETFVEMNSFSAGLTAGTSGTQILPTPYANNLNNKIDVKSDEVENLEQDGNLSNYLHGPVADLN